MRYKSHIFRFFFFSLRMSGFGRILKAPRDAFIMKEVGVMTSSVLLSI